MGIRLLFEVLCDRQNIFRLPPHPCRLYHPSMARFPNPIYLILRLQRKLNEMELTKAKELAEIESKKFTETVESIGQVHFALHRFQRNLVTSCAPPCCMSVRAHTCISLCLCLHAEFVLHRTRCCRLRKLGQRCRPSYWKDWA